MLAQGLGRKKSLDISIWEIPRIRDTIVGFPGKKRQHCILGSLLFFFLKLACQARIIHSVGMILFSRRIASVWRALRVAEQVYYVSCTKCCMTLCSPSPRIVAT